ncbi:T9SS type A sorting domain-containing protein [Paucihalobacter ruber]|uniref:T9SS type A sorting domain-containing protein n=1 Tax=Paucihalobacter ruber TaxID=2567861 RepID=A0A506PJM2_9FLAO|nr:T9SS type A sorting domain-containing protein [Paucihalobacter ruber]TPV33282.1 T9SS type A sorting domain-containing protein [Paucihalobacter ruber]
MKTKKYNLKTKISSLLFLILNFALVAQQSISGSFSSNGNTRGYIGAIPDNLQTPLRLVIMFCGATENASQMQLRGYNNFLGNNSMIIYPEPFNATFGFDNSNGIDDFQMVEDLITNIASNYTINVNDICIGGFSNGGVFTYNLVCDFNSPSSTRAYRFKSFAVVSGAMEASNANITDCPIANELPAIVFHGTSDPVIPYNGGNVGFPLNIQTGATETTVNFWANTINNCTSTPMVTSLPNTNTTDGSSVELLNYDCATSEETLLYRIIGGQHAWPSGNANFDIAQNRNLDINASEVISQFFEDPTTLSNNDFNNLENEILIYPNPVKDFIVVKSTYNLDKIELFNLKGKVIMSYDQPLTSISLESLESGIYLLKIHAENRKIIKKIAKQ